MLNLKKTAVAVLVLGGSAAFAGTMGPVCSAVNVTVPCESTAWDVGARALYLQPSSTAGAYSFSGINTNGQFVDYSNKWGWGFMIEGSYHYNTGNDANINWYHIGNSSGNKTFTTTSAYMAPNIGTVPAGTTGAASVSPKWDAVNVEFGQRVDFGDMKHIRFHGGVQYARVANSASLTAMSGTNGSAFSASSSRNPTYNGFGPRLGADLSYDWSNGLGIYANGAGAILAGTAKASNAFAVSGTQVGANGFNTSYSNSHSLIAPELEAKLGLKYDYAMAQGDLTLDIGWMWVNYFNVGPSLLSTGADIVNNDFGLQGLYFGLKWIGNVA